MKSITRVLVAGLVTSVAAGVTATCSTQVTGRRMDPSPLTIHENAGPDTQVFANRSKKSGWGLGGRNWTQRPRQLPALPAEPWFTWPPCGPGTVCTCPPPVSTFPNP